MHFLRAHIYLINSSQWKTRFTCLFGFAANFPIHSNPPAFADLGRAIEDLMARAMEELSKAKYMTLSCMNHISSSGCVVKLGLSHGFTFGLGILHRL